MTNSHKMHGSANIVFGEIQAKKPLDELLVFIAWQNLVARKNRT